MTDYTTTTGGAQIVLLAGNCLHDTNILKITVICVMQCFKKYSIP